MGCLSARAQVHRADVPGAMLYRTAKWRGPQRRSGSGRNRRGIPGFGGGLAIRADDCQVSASRWNPPPPGQEVSRVAFLAQPHGEILGRSRCLRAVRWSVLRSLQGGSISAGVASLDVDGALPQARFVGFFLPWGLVSRSSVSIREERWSLCKGWPAPVRPFEDAINGA